MCLYAPSYTRMRTSVNGTVFTRSIPKAFHARLLLLTEFLCCFVCLLIFRAFLFLRRRIGWRLGAFLILILAAVALAPRWTSSYNNMCFYFAYQAVTLADCVPRDWQNSMCAPPLPMRSIHASSPGVLCMCLRQQREGEDG